MADSTFEKLWKKIRVYAPDIPVPLAQEMINTAYSRALSYHLWQDLRIEAAFSIPVLYSAGSANVTLGGQTVTGVGTTWTSDMINRQFFTAGGTVTAPTSADGVQGPYYTITGIDTGAQTLTLDRVYGKPTATSISYNILQVYLQAPSDFMNFVSVRDVDNNWKLHTNFRQEQLDVWDAKRSVSGTSWILAGAPPLGNTINRFELWPRTSPGPRVLQYRYVRKPALLSAASDTPIWPMRGDILRKGALAELAMWPGTKDYLNPYFNLDLHRTLDGTFTQGLNDLVRQDNEKSQRAIWYEDWEGVPYAPIDARYLQTHDIFSSLLPILLPATAALTTLASYLIA